MIRSLSAAALTATLALPLLSHPAMALQPPVMVEETASSGIVHAYTGGWEYFVGGGVTALDCNGDGYQDLFLAGGSSTSGLFVNRSTRGGPLTFSASEAAAIEGVTGAYPMDIDGDGITDLALLRLGENILLRGRGDCQFENANAAWGFDGGDAWTTAFAASWETGQDWPTLAFGNYVDRSQPGQPWGTCHDNYLIRPNATGTGFAAATILTPGYCALSMLFSDWNRSGSPALRISNDRQYYRGGEEQLWHLDLGQPPSLYTAEQGWRHLTIWGMGIASYDVTGDGYPDYYLTSMGDNKLRGLSNGPGQPSYGDMSRPRGVTAHRPFTGGDILPSTGWHAQFEDVNNDGFVDLFVAKGNVHSMSDFAMKDPNNLLIGLPDGRFEEVADKAGLASEKRSRGAVITDLNLDGLLDVVVVNREENVQLWRNAGAGDGHPLGNWVALTLEQPGGNHQAIGAWVEVRVGARTQRREITIGGGHASGQASWHHFGLGVAERALVRVQWPDGEWGPWIRLFANQFARISRGNSKAALWLPPRAANGQ